MDLVQGAVADLFPESVERSSGFDDGAPGPMANPGPAAPPTRTSAPADLYADCEGMLMIGNAAGSWQEASASSEGSGHSMPDSRADGPGCCEAAPEVAGNSLNPEGHQLTADDVFVEDSSNLPDYESD